MFFDVKIIKEDFKEDYYILTFTMVVYYYN